jgi:hypothetical protein
VKRTSMDGSNDSIEMEKLLVVEIQGHEYLQTCAQGTWERMKLADMKTKILVRDVVANIISVF